MLFDVMMPRVTFIYAGVLGILYFLLSANVIRYRRSLKVGIGHDPDPSNPLFRAVRIHSNFGEYVPYIILLMMMDEMTGRSAEFVHVFGSALVLSRIMHYFALTDSHRGGSLRVIGMASTFMVLLFLSFLLIIKGIQ